MPNALWSLVLAAGAGRRLAAVTGGVPKQFWSPDQGPTLLERTLERTRAFAPPHRTVAVVDRTHVSYVANLRGRAGVHHWIHQPCDRGTAAGVLLGLAYVYRRAPNAVVLLTPSDQGVGRPEIFARGIRRAIDAVQGRRANIVLFGAAPDRFDVDYGWITPGSPEALAPVAGFVEKPAAGVARSLFASGSVWNTMVLVGRVADLVELFRVYLPDLWSALMGAPFTSDPQRGHQPALDYGTVQSADFSRDVLGMATGLSVSVWPSSMQWSDLGTPDRLAAWRHAAAVDRMASFGPSRPVSGLHAAVS